MQDGTWSEISLGTTEVLTPYHPLSPLFNEADIYLDEIPKNPKIASDTNAPSEPIALAYVVATSISITHITSKLYGSGAT